MGILPIRKGMLCAWRTKFPACLRGLALCLGVLALFAPEGSAAKSCGRHYRRLELPPLTLQETDHTCGAACIRSLVKQLSGRDLDESHVAAVIGNNRSIGTTPEKMAKGLRLLGFRAKVQKNMGQASLRSNFRRGKGQIFLIQSGDTAHWVVLADYKDGRITLMDPWRENSDYLTYTEEEFVALWDTKLMGRKSKQLGIVVE